MTRYYLVILKVINALVFLWILVIFLSVFQFDKVITTSEGELVLSSFLTSLRNISTYAIFTAAYGVAFVCVMVASILFFAVQPYMLTLLNEFFRGLLGLWFTFPNGTTPEFSEIPDLIGQEFAVFSENFYLIAFQLLFIIAIYYAIKAFLKTDPKNDLRVVGSIVLMLVVPLMVFGFRDMLELFNITIPYLEYLPYPLDSSLEAIPIDNIFQFFASPVILLAIASYIYLEMAFQINYTFTVTKPSVERSYRLEAQLSVLQSESHYITANVDKIKEEAKKKKQELKIDEKATIGKFFAKTGETFSYVKEMIEKRKLEDEEKKLITAASKTRRLGRYIHRLFQEDKEARDTLTAKSSAPKPKSLIVSTIINFTFRVGLLIIISFIIIHPKWFMENVFNLPPAIIESVAIFSPEVIVILLIPLILIFPVVSKIISSIKHRNLIIRLQQEGRIKEILASVGDYVKKEEAIEEKDLEIQETAA
jgi:cell division protein FtsB